MRLQVWIRRDVAIVEHRVDQDLLRKGNASVARCDGDTCRNSTPGTIAHDGDAPRVYAEPLRVCDKP